MQDQYVSACYGISVASGAVPTKKRVVQQTSMASCTVSALSYVGRVARCQVQYYHCTALARCPRKSTWSSCRRRARLTWTRIGLSGSLDQKPTCITYTTMNLKDPVWWILSSYPPPFKDHMTSFLNLLKGCVTFCIIRTVLMILEQVHKLHVHRTWKQSLHYWRQSLSILIVMLLKSEELVIENVHWPHSCSDFDILLG